MEIPFDGSELVSILEVGFYGLNFLLVGVCGWVLVTLIRNIGNRSAAELKVMVLGVCAFMVAILAMAGLAIFADKYDRPVTVTFDIKPGKAGDAEYGILIQHLDENGKMTTVPLESEGDPRTVLRHKSQATIVVEDLFDRLNRLETEVNSLNGQVSDLNAIKRSLAAGTAPENLSIKESGF